MPAPTLADTPFLAVTVDKALRAAIYTRASRDPRKRGITTRGQLLDNRKTCETNRWAIAGEFEDIDRSASEHAKRRRPDFDALVEFVRSGQCDVVVTWEASRFHRDLAVYLQLRDICGKAGVFWCYNGTTYDLSKPNDRFRTGLDALIAEQEANTARERTLRGVRQRAQAGLPSAVIPYGYRREYDSATGDLLAQLPHEDRAPIVREICRRIAVGDSAYSIARDLNAREVPTPRGSKDGWIPQTVVALARNPAYIAKRVHNGEIIGDATWPPIIDDITHYTCIKVLSDPARKTNHTDSRAVHLLSGIGQCGVCGGVLQARRNNRQLSYTCVSGFCVSIARSVLEDFVSTALLERMERPDVLDVFTVEGEDENADGALQRVREMETTLREARDLVGDGQLSVASLAALEQQLLPRIESARREATVVKLPAAVLRMIGPDARTAWADASVAERREVVRTLVTVRLNQAGRGTRKLLPGRITVLWKTASSELNSNDERNGGPGSR